MGALLAACLAAMPVQAGASPLFSGAVLPLAAQMMASDHCGRLTPAIGQTIGMQSNLAAGSATSKASDSC